MNTMTTETTSSSRSDFFGDGGLNSMAHAMLGRIHTGAADTGEVLTTIDRIADGTTCRGSENGRAQQIGSPTSDTGPCMTATG